MYKFWKKKETYPIRLDDISKRNEKKIIIIKYSGKNKRRDASHTDTLSIIIYNLHDAGVQIMF